ncbi:MAG: SRPBCC family protein [Chloroflexi bacterium]|nr:SRPBCC family protein [Chloroflexota bacterium]
MPTISVEFIADVQATADKLWDILTDVDSWLQWQGTHFVKLSEPSRITEGSNFTVELGGLKWGLKVMKAERPHKIVWVGQRLGLKAVHEWEFNEIEGKTIVTTRESMTGWILFLTYPIVRKTLSSTDGKWLNDLKIRAEST